MNKSISATLIAFGEIRDTYNFARDQGASSQEAFRKVLNKFPNLPVVELAVALNYVECDYDRRIMNYQHAAKSVMFDAMNRKRGTRFERSPAL